MAEDMENSFSGYIKKQQSKEKNLSLSFQFVDHSNNYFYLHGMTKDYYTHLTKLFVEIQNSTAESIKTSYGTSFNPKPILFKKFEKNPKNGKKSTISHGNFPINEESDIYEFIKQSTEKQDGNKGLEKVIEDNIQKFVENSFELSVAKSLGRIHGFLFGDIFYIVWFDPAHNLFLSKHKGESGKVKLADELHKIKPVCPTSFQEYNKRLNAVEDLVMELLEQETIPENDNILYHI